ncbi:MAG: hypothetical protein ASARMPRED_002846 [Alectoria sarmentosa]|nr:MAG: hypothetical protein ASARMPRED_002846 [Alectoria sarmentosa]
MSMPLSNLTAPNLTVVSHGPTTVFSPVLEETHTLSAAAKALQERHESPCIQTVEVPVWYGVNYNTCSMQTTTAPCSVDFPETSCHTARPGPLLQSQGISGSTKLWVVISITIFLTMLIPVVVLWARWKLSAPRRGGKRIISVQLEKDEAKKATSTPSSSSSSTPKSGSNSKSSSTSGGGNPEELPPTSPQVALESLRSDHPLHQPPNRPWMHPDPTGRWVPLEQGYLHPGLPPPPRVRNVGTNIIFVDHGSYVPGGWQN